MRINIQQLDAIAGAYGVTVLDVDGRPHVLAGSIMDDRVNLYDPRVGERRIVGSFAGTIDIAVPPDVSHRPGCVVISGFNCVREREQLECRDTYLHWMTPTATGAWNSEKIVDEPFLHRVLWADMNGDGRKEIVACTIRGNEGPPPNLRLDFPPFPEGCRAGPWSSPGAVYWYEQPGGTGTPWVRHLVLDDLRLNHGVTVTDLDGDGHDDLLIGSNKGILWIDLDRYWTGSPDAIVQISPDEASEVAVFRSAPGAAPTVVAVEPWHGNRLAYYRPSGASLRGPWHKRVVKHDLAQGHSLCCADFDDNGRIEVVVGELAGRKLHLYEVSPDGDTWQHHLVDDNMGPGFAVVARGLQPNGRLSLVCSGLFSENLKIYRFET